MKRSYLFIVAVVIIIFTSCSNAGKPAENTAAPSTQKAESDSIKWLRYTDDNLSIAFSVPRPLAEMDSAEKASGTITSLGWMKPDDAQIGKGLNTYLCYEDGFMLHIWDNNFDFGKETNFAAYGNRIYDSNQMTKDAFVKFRDGRKSKIGNSDVYAFSIPVQLDSKLCRMQYEDVRIPVEGTTEQAAETIHWCQAVYFTHGTHHFRILYDDSNPTGKKIFESFRIEE